ncbi:MAG: deoxyhypusine synthase family protein, partial [Candidatus Aenigmarchaeota archaeon]|nr:deoxyhypusine synthase family protein [Candidatus Aenigmarchaeota archaeon]
MDKKHMDGKDIVPVHSPEKISFKALIGNYSKTCFEARNVADGARLFEAMVNDKDTIWLGIAGAGIVGGLGGYVIDLIKNGFIDVICTTGAQAYHDLHFAYGLPMKQGYPKADDNVLRKEGVIRIYDIFLDESKTLLAQDKKIREFANEMKL